MTEQIKAMKELGFTDAEIKDVLETDKRIDRGEKLFELSEDQKAVEKKMRQAERKSPNYTFTKRERKPNNDKQYLIQIIQNALESNTESLEVSNAEREINFTYNNKKYKIILSMPRN